MDGRSRPTGHLLLGALGFAAIAACNDPFGFEPQVEEPEEEEICPSSEEWLPVTPPLPMFNPLPHPASECPFYRGAWHSFLVATQPDEAGRPAFLKYPTSETMFQSARPRAPNRSVLGLIKQAGSRQILIDQNNRTLFYAIHANQAFADFVNRNNLRTRQGIEAADPNLFFPAGVVTFKSAWQEVSPTDPTNDTYITVRTTVPRLRQLPPPSKEIIEDRNQPRETTVRLLALHVVFTLPGHPEFIWGTFEHSNGTPDTKAEDGKRNVAPNIHFNPDLADPNNQKDTTVVCPDAQHLLCRAGTKANEANRPIPESELNLDEASQTFPGQQTSIYRMYPASKSHTIEPDASLTSLNHNVEQLFIKAAREGRVSARDKRGHYRQVGSQWMDKPAYFTLNSALQNDRTSPFASVDGYEESIRELGGDSDYSILAGEDRLSSTAMESFTQAPDSFANCFACHNTQAVTARGVPLNRDLQGTQLLPPKLINVSHIFSEFIAEEIRAGAQGGP
jgi:hypothetical protein